MIVIALALLGGPTTISVQNEADAFTLHSQNLKFVSKRLFKDSLGIGGNSPANNVDFGLPWDNNDANSEAKSIRYPYHHELVQEQDNNSDCESDEEYPGLVNRRSRIVLLKDSSITKVPVSQVRDNGLHMLEFLSKNSLKGKFDVTKYY